MRRARQFFINLRVDLFGSGINKNKKPVYQARTYHYNSASTRHFGHGKLQKSPSPTTTRPTTRATTRNTHHEQYVSSMPGSWPEEYSSPRASPPPSYQEVERHPVPQYHKTRYRAESPATIYKQEITTHNIPTTEAKPVAPKSRHLRSGSDILVVQHPTPQDVYG